MEYICCAESFIRLAHLLPRAVVLSRHWLDDDMQMVVNENLTDSVKRLRECLDMMSEPV